ncbi:MAG: hypothetical protein J7L66_03585 [Anaerolineaceae bacterium]|nr:hypothetical protein [Anaerolineaceae bacterium]
MSKKKTRKQNKRRTSKQEPKPTQQGGVKISEAILRINEPLRNRYQEPHRIEMIIYLTVMAWNISLFKGEERTELQEKIIEKLPQDFGGEDVAVLLNNLEMLIERKEKEFPDIREYIMDHQVSFSGNSFNLNVTAAPIKERKENASS